MAATFAGWLDPLGPFEPAPNLAVAVSGGADSMALALLAHDWARARGGTAQALIVDHGLRPESADEAALALARAERLGIGGRILALRDLPTGPALAARARRARYAALEGACAEAGILHLLVGHHAGDQAETVVMRLLRASGADGLAGMAALLETRWVRILRPLLAATPAALRATLRQAGVEWLEDPSNRDRRATRTRLREALADPTGADTLVRAHAERTRRLGRGRAAREAADAAWLGRHARLHPSGFALLLALPDGVTPLRTLVRVVGGRALPPSSRAAGAWLRAPRAASLAGVLLRPAGRLAPGGWLVMREPAAQPPPVPARAGALWDGRFRLLDAHPDPTATLGAPIAGRPLGRAALPALLRRTIPVLHGAEPGAPRGCWWPPGPLSGAGFVPADGMAAPGMHNPGRPPML